MTFLMLIDWTGMAETESFAQECQSCSDPQYRTVSLVLKNTNEHVRCKDGIEAFYLRATESQGTQGELKITGGSAHGGPFPAKRRLMSLSRKPAARLRPGSVCL